MTESWLLLGAGLLLAGIIAYFALEWHRAYWVRTLTVETEYQLTETVRTPDGSAFELRRLAGANDAGLTPVVMVHGIAANHRNHDPWPGTSLARFLHEVGHDVWLVTLRSGRQNHSVGEPIGFAEMVRYDVPLAVEEVRRRTGAPQVDYIGFSMGGILLYAALGRTLDASHVRKAVTIGSPGRIGLPFRFLSFAKWVPRRFVPPLHLRFFAQLAAFASEWFPITPVHTLVYNKKNVPPGGTRWALVNIVQNIPASLQADFKEFAFDRGGKLVLDGVDVLEGLNVVATPVLFVVGKADQLAPPRSVQHAFDAWAANHESPDKRMIVLGRETGTAHDYGHGDLALGTHVVADVFAPVLDFLQEKGAFAKTPTDTRVAPATAE